MPVRKTYLILFIALAFLGAAVNIQAGWLYILVSVLLGFLLLEWIGTWRSVAPLEITVYLPELMEAGKEAPFTLVVNPGGGKGKGSVELILSSPFGKKEKARFNVALPLEQPSFQGSFQPGRRGSYSLEMVEAHFMGRMGLFRWKRKIPLPKPRRILVHPPLHPVSMTLLAAEESLLWSVGTAPRPGEGSDLFFGVREYGPRDTLQRIHWKSLARTGKVMVKQFQPERPQRLFLIFDNSPAEDPDAFERAATLGVNLARRLLQQGFSLQVLDQKEVHAFHGREQIHELLGYFAQIREAPGDLAHLLGSAGQRVEGRALFVLPGLKDERDATLLHSLFSLSHLFLLSGETRLAEPLTSRGWTVSIVSEGQDLKAFLAGEGL